jgi:hypothetical protein
MLKLKAASFYGVTAGLQVLGNKIKDGQLKSLNETPDGGLLISYQSDPVLMKHLKAEVEELRINLATLGTRVTTLSANKLAEALSAPEGFTWETVGQLWEEVHSRLLDELGLVSVFVLTEREAGYFEPANPIFGADVAAKFGTDAAFEIDEAGKCLALGRPTASVFHLMRTMEIAIRAIARCLQIPDPSKPAERNWATILKMIKEGIEAKWTTSASRMTGDGGFFVEILAMLEAVRTPWRNATMHVEKKYSDDEAEHIFVAVKGFMRKLASRCDEKGEPMVEQPS